MGALERGGDRPAGPRGVRMGRMLGFFESFTFFQIERRPWAFVGPVALIHVCVFQSDLSTPIGVSLIVVPDTFKFQMFYYFTVICYLSTTHFLPLPAILVWTHFLPFIHSIYLPLPVWTHFFTVYSLSFLPLPAIYLCGRGFAACCVVSFFS